MKNFDKQTSYRLFQAVLIFGVVFVCFRAVTGVTVFEYLFDADAQNYQYYRALWSDMKAEINVGMSQEEADEILAGVAAAHSTRYITIDRLEYKDGTETDRYRRHYIIHFGGDPTSSGVNSHCSASIFFYVDISSNSSTVHELDSIYCDS